MSYKLVGDALYNILVDIKNSPTSGLVDAFPYDNPDGGSNGYPYAIVTPAPGQEKELDTATNFALYRFIIRATNVSKDKAGMEDNMRTLADDILSELRKRGRQDLGGIADRMTFDTSWSWDSTNNTPTRLFEIEVSVERHHSID